MIWQLDALLDSANRVKCKEPNSNEWVPSRPDNFKYESWARRIKAAFLVLTGKADAVVWPNNQ